MVTYQRQVTVSSGGLVVKQFASGEDWSEYPVLYPWGTVGYDRPEVFSQKERAFIRNRLTVLASNK